MRDKKVSLGLRVALAIFALILCATSAGAAQEKVLHSFGNGTDGTEPYFAGVIFDAAGNLYGTTSSGGIHDAGTVFGLSPREGGGWTARVLHSFNNNEADGANPQAGLVFDHNGNLYGTTYSGGIHGNGTVFELSPNGDGSWTEKVLHSFSVLSGTDGFAVYAGLIVDAAGNLYGTTAGGGIHRGGTVFEFSPKQGGGWTEKILHNFNENSPDDGTFPYAGLAFDSEGNLYGTTGEGGLHGAGTVFELSPNGSGGWSEKILHSFGHGNDGVGPLAGLVVDNTGHVFGTTSGGGIHGWGCAFELSPREGGGWTETVIHSFGNGTDGVEPEAALVLDSAGNLYGTTLVGGLHEYGMAYELSPEQDGGWHETVLHNFSNGTDGALVYSGLVFDAAGNLYGTTFDGGIHGEGTVFEIVP